MRITVKMGGQTRKIRVGWAGCVKAWTKYLKRPQTLNVGFSYKLTSKDIWRQVFICLRPRSPPCYTLYKYIPLYTHHRKGGGGGIGEPVRRLEGR